MLEIVLPPRSGANGNAAKRGESLANLQAFARFADPDR